MQDKFGPYVWKGECVAHNAGRMTQIAKILDIPIIACVQKRKLFGNTIEAISKHYPDGQVEHEKTHFSMLLDSVKEELSKTS